MNLQPRPVDTPPHYPAAYERELRLNDGRRVAIRPIVPADAPDLAAAIRSADSETLRRRFLGGAPRITPELLARLTQLDYTHRFALVAADATSGQGIAIARYERLADGVAEVAVAVDPAWRRAGLATAMVEILAQAALERGIHGFSASYLADNRPVTALLSLADVARPRPLGHGLAESEVELDQGGVAAAVRAMNTRPSSDHRQRHARRAVRLFGSASRT
ncbi:GNAT family N-acetyltransferase [Streptomyces sp. NPDC057616]|uniref:GNAT family N-acetyltransferase n=1 Tax=Streptomyces sp. NPDC057616 TaxID=3346183 RepID=UPI0036C95D3A